MVRILLLVLVISLLSVNGSGAQRIKYVETIALTKKVIIKGPFMTPKLIDDWTEDIPYGFSPDKDKSDLHDFKQFDTETNPDHEKEYPYPLQWPSRNGEQFIPLAKPEDKKPKYIPIEPIGANYKLIQTFFTKR